MTAEVPNSPALAHEIESSSGLSISHIEPVTNEALTPSELFANHVDAVYTQDIPGAEIIKHTGHPLRYIGPRLACGTVLGEGTHYLANHVGAIDTPAGLMWVVGATSIVVGANKLRRERARRHYLRDNGEKLQDEIGHAYELYRTTNKSTGEVTMSMEWFGCPRYEDEEKNDFASDVYAITNLATQNGISKITVGEDILRQSMPGYALPEQGPRSDQQFMQDNGVRPYLVHMSGKQRNLYTFTPDELRSYVESQLGGKGIHGLCTQLTRLNKADPVAQYYQRLVQQKSDDATLKKELEAAVKTQLKLGLNGSAYAAFKVDGAPLLARADSVKHISGETVTEYRMLPTSTGETLVQVDFSSLDDAMNIAKQDLELFDRDPSLVSRHKQRAILYRRIYSTARQTEGPTSNPANATRGAEGGIEIQPQHNVGTQQALVQAVYSYPWFSRERDNCDGSTTRVSLKMRAIAGICALAVGGITSTVVHDKLDERITTVMQQIAGSAEVGSLSNDELRKQAAQESILTHVAYKLELFEDQLTRQFSKPVIAGIRAINPELLRATTSNAAVAPDPLATSAEDAPSTHSSATGTIPGEKNQISWRLAAHEMDTSGLWQTDTTPVYDDGRWIKTSFGQYTSLELPTSLSDASQPHVEVSRTISDRDARSLAIPVLEGTRPASINFNGKPVRVKTWDNGSFTIDLPETEETGNLSYAVVSANTQGLRAVTNTLLPYADAYDKTPAELWRQALKGARQLDPKQRISQEIAYIKNTFDYNLAPLDDSRRIQHSIGNIVDKALTKKQADCFIASTILAADNTSLNVAIGWKNTNIDNKPQILSSHEAHAWTVDKAGVIYDATPTKNLENFDAYFDESGLIKQDIKNHTDDTIYYISGSVALAVAGYVYSRRRRIAKVAKRVYGYTLVGIEDLADRALTAQPTNLALTLAARELPFIPDTYSPEEKAAIYHQRVSEHLTKSQSAARRDLSQLAAVDPKAIYKAARQIGLPRNVRQTVTTLSLARSIVQGGRIRDYHAALAKRTALANKAQQKPTTQ